MIPSHASIISQKNNVSKPLAFRTLKRIKETSKFKNKHKRNKGNQTRNENKLYPRYEVVDSVSSERYTYNFPIGLFLIDDDGIHVEDDICTASVINTENGNIGLTAAHCLYDTDGIPIDLDRLSFSPGYDDNDDGPLGAIPISDTAVPFVHMVDLETKDYALIRFDFDRGKVQDYTGALGYRFDIEDDESTNAFGYPKNGDLENCPKDGEHLCEWQGNTEKTDYYTISDVDLGDGVSGGPFISQYDRDENLGYAYAVYRGYDIQNNQGVAAIWDEITFNNLLLELTP
ncbi:42458_t:CDS:1 [Gigaspora margarita]|uniref:42458_t:CDS:1 n=1 Tax=Gigaspora margarita TaxID=4874 RepID=A0ABN7UM09_GIGMA|nr:42458_t:CDS:1 [Gigaspora margarita]